MIEKMRRWPVVGLFVPQPMPWPSRQGKYFAWGERDEDPMLRLRNRLVQAGLAHLCSIEGLLRA